VGCAVRTAEQKAERFPGSTARVTSPYECQAYPTLQLLAKRLQGWGVDPQGYATIVGGAIMSKLTCVTLANVICIPL